MAVILSVDDSQVVRNMVSVVLTRAGHEVVTAVDGAEALNICRERVFDLVLSDVHMPNINGISLVSKLRRLDGYAEVPILMLTTDDTEYKKNKARSFGANGWLVKPFTPDRLTDAIDRLLAA